MQHTPIFILKRSELWKENFVLLKHKFWRQIDALLFQFHNQTPTDIISLTPQSVKSFSLPLLLMFQRELWRLWIQVPLATFQASSPVRRPFIDFAKDWSIPRSEIFLFFFFPFLAGTIFMNLFLVKERVDPKLLYIFLSRLMHSANSFLIF